MCPQARRRRTTAGLHRPAPSSPPRRAGAARPWATAWRIPSVPRPRPRRRPMCSPSDYSFGLQRRELRLGETELAHEDGVVVGTDPASGMTHLARCLAELRHHALHAHRAEVDVRHRDYVLACDILRILAALADVGARAGDDVGLVEQLHNLVAGPLLEPAGDDLIQRPVVG